jgi:hypothetical protein
MGRLGKTTIVLGALLALAGCAMEGATAEDEAAVAAEEDLLIRGTTVFADPPTRLTVYSEAGLWGTNIDVPLTPSGTAEQIRLITKTQVEAAGLLRRISSVRLSCGARDAHVVLFNDYNTSTSLSGWSEFGTGHMVYCSAGQTVEVNLHTQAPGYADRVASIYFVQHAREVSELGLSWLVTSFWNASLDELPDGAEASGGPRLRLRGSSFDIRQNLRLDSFWCEERGGHFVLRATLGAGGTWTASFVSRYVDTGTGDSWGCRSEMESALESGARDAAARLAAGLNDDLMPLAGTHARHYLVPIDSMRDFSLVSGGDPIAPPVVYDFSSDFARGI